MICYLTLYCAPIIEARGVEMASAIIGVHQATQFAISSHVEALQVTSYILAAVSNVF